MPIELNTIIATFPATTTDVSGIHASRFVDRGVRGVTNAEEASDYQQPGAFLVGIGTRYPVVVDSEFGLLVRSGLWA